MLTLRPYQSEAINAVYKHLRERDDNPCVVCPTGSGKSYILAQIAYEAVMRWNGRVLLLAHVKELLEQNAEKLRKLAPQLPIGLYSAGLRSRDSGYAITVAGIQSVYRRAAELGRFDLAIVDECFPAGTLVDGIPIEAIKPGQRIRSFNQTTKRIELKRVLAVSKHPIHRRMARVTLTDGREIVCTANHPFFTGERYVEAQGLMEVPVVYVSRVRTGHPRTKRKPVPLLLSSKSEVLFHRVLEPLSESLIHEAQANSQTREKTTSSKSTLEDAVVRLHRVRIRYPEADIQPIQGLQTEREDVLRERVLSLPKRQTQFHPHDCQKPDEKPGDVKEGVRDNKADRSSIGRSGRKGTSTNEATADALESPRLGMDSGACDQDAIAQGERQRDMVCCRLGAPCCEDLRRGRRRFAQISCGSRSRCSQGLDIEPIGVANVEILEQGDSHRSGQSREGSYVYNLQVECNENYFANDLLVHNCHMIPPDGEGMYRSFLADAHKVNPHLRVIGLTATPYRMKSGYVCAPENILNHVCYEIGVRELIVQGYLCPLITKGGREDLDTDGLHVRAGEFMADEVEALMDQEQRVEAACTEISSHMHERNSCLVFTSSVKHAEHVAKVLERTCDTVATVFGDTPDTRRAETIAGFKTGRIKYLVNVNVLTHGFDAPNVDCVAILRPTMSPGLFSQIVGRGFRLYPGKENCLILDFGGNVLRHGPVDAIRIKEPGSNGRGEPPAKKCPECLSIIAAGYALCPDCGYEFPKPNRGMHDPYAGTAGVLSGQVTTTKYSVQETHFSIHIKRDAPEDAPKTMRVEYRIVWKYYQSEWLCFEHIGWARHKAESWWRQRSNAPMPVTAADAVAMAKAGALCETKEITVRSVVGERYDRIIGYELGEKPFYREPGWDEEEDAVIPIGAERDFDDVPF